MRSTQIRLSGECDISSSEALSELFAPLAGCDEVVIDMSDVSYIDSVAIRCFVRLRNEMKQRTADPVIRLEHVTPGVRRILEITRLDRMLQITSE